MCMNCQDALLLQSESLIKLLLAFFVAFTNFLNMLPILNQCYQVYNSFQVLCYWNTVLACGR